jgi:hypothetical protein
VGALTLGSLAPGSPGRGWVRSPGVANDHPLLAPIEGAQHSSFGGIEVDVMALGAARLKRLVYPVGSRWSVHVQPLVDTDACMHAHVGFLAQGHMHGTYGDGCEFDFVAPTAMLVSPGHDMWVVGDEPAVLIQVDFEHDTTGRLGVPDAHAPH